jgi:T5SS/PEP-CTERM-associated repeat protein
MEDYEWVASASTANFGIPGNWQILSTGILAVVPPGVNDRATIDTAGAVITGVGTVAYILFLDAKAVEGQLTGLLAIKASGDMKLLPGAVLTTSLLNIAMQTNDTGTVVVGEQSSIVINGNHPTNSYAIYVGQGTGSKGKLHVHGYGAVVNGGNEPIVIGHKGHGVLRIRKGGNVAAGNADPYLFPFAVVIGNRSGSVGKVKVSDASLSARGEIVVGRSGSGFLDVESSGVVTAEKMEIGLSTGGAGSVTVHGEHALLVIAGTLTVGGAGSGSLVVADHGCVTVNVGLQVTGSISLADGLIETSSLVVNAGAVLAGHGKVVAAAGFSNAGTIAVHHRLILIGDISNNGTIEVGEGAHLTCVGTFGAANDTGSVVLGAGSVASLGAVTSGQTVSFTGSGTLRLHSPQSFAGTIAGFAPGDMIELDAQPPVAPTFNSASGMLTVQVNGFTTGISFTGSYSTSSFVLTDLPDGGALISHA